jgi:hypothetical protein
MDEVSYQVALAHSVKAAKAHGGCPSDTFLQPWDHRRSLLGVY